MVSPPLVFTYFTIGGFFHSPFGLRYVEACIAADLKG
ncbi:unnamed protein product, partial [Staurois parvus]